MVINLSAEMIATLTACCNEALVQYEARIPFLKSRARLARDEATTRVREQNVSLMEEQIEETKAALDMLHELHVSQKAQKA